MKFFGVCFLACLLGTAHGIYNRYVYEFGQDYGYTLQHLDGQIPILTAITEKHVPIPDYYKITYIRVTVDAISPPKVDFNSDTRVVSIMYNWTQISSSRYSILVKGILSQ